MPSKPPAQTDCVRRSHSGSADHSGAPSSEQTALQESRPSGRLHSVPFVPPLPTKTATLGFRGGPRVPPTSFTLLDRARPVFSFSSGRKFGAPAATQRSGCGGERRKEWSRAQSSPSGGDGAGGISSDDMGGAMNQPSLAANFPRPSGRAKSPLTGGNQGGPPCLIKSISSPLAAPKTR